MNNEGMFHRAKQKAIEVKKEIKETIRSTIGHFGVSRKEIRAVIPWSVAIFLISYALCCVLSKDKCWFVGWFLSETRNFLCAFLQRSIAYVEKAIDFFEGEGAAINQRQGGLGGALRKSGRAVKQSAILTRPSKRRKLLNEALKNNSTSKG